MSQSPKPQFAQRKSATRKPPAWGDSAAIEALLEDQEDLEAQEAGEEAEALIENAKGPDGTAVVVRKGPVPFEPTEEQRRLVKDMARCGMPHETMTLMVRWPKTGRPLSVRTLRLYFSEELYMGHIEVGMQLYSAAYKKAMAGDTGALCFLLKTGYGFREVNRTEVTGADGKDLPVGAGVVLIPTPASAEEWESAVGTHQQTLANRAAEFMAGKGEFTKGDK